MAAPPSFGALHEEKLPPKVPIGVRAMATITTSWEPEAPLSLRMPGLFTSTVCPPAPPAAMPSSPTSPESTGSAPVAPGDGSAKLAADVLLVLSTDPSDVEAEEPDVLRSSESPPLAKTAGSTGLSLPRVSSDFSWIVWEKSRVTPGWNLQACNEEVVLDVRNWAGSTWPQAFKRMRRMLTAIVSKKHSASLNQALLMTGQPLSCLGDCALARSSLKS
jgi:hypothetical protein